MQNIHAFHLLKACVVSSTGQSHDVLAINIGLAIYLLCQICMGTRRGSWMALAMVGLADVFNIGMNAVYFGAWHWNEAVYDTALMLLWPTLLAVTSRFRRWRWNVQNNPLAKARKSRAAMPVGHAGSAVAVTVRTTGKPYLRIIAGHRSNRAPG
jgi:hypothetical protein